MEEEEKVIVSLHKQPLASERKEIEQKRRRIISIILICVIFLMSGISLGYLIFRNNFINTSSGQNNIDDVRYIIENYWYYGDEYEDLNSELNNRALYGMTTFAEDPYTMYMSPDVYEEFSSSINMDYVGIGVQYTTNDNIFTVSRVFKQSPAEEAGILPGDIIKAVDHTSCENLDSDSLKAMVLGPENTEVVITVLRGTELLDITAIRKQVSTSVYCYAKDDYVVMELSSFGSDTAKAIMSYLDNYTDYEKIIIDLRDNSGGYQSAVQEIAGLFIGNDKVYMKQIDKNKNEVVDNTKCEKTYGNFKKIAIITNSSTASAAEVLTICLKEQFPNTIQVGTTTYGKGVVQSNIGLSDGSSVKVTTSEWLSPNGVSINKIGVEPDIEVLLPDIMYERLYDMPEDDVYELDSVSQYVKLSQECLAFLNYDVERTDGYFDESFANALRQFKKDNNLKDDSILDADTYESICSVAIHVCSTDDSYDTQMAKAIEVIHED
ncbi:MAG: S41 family peptidase [Erysipelotrichaceae bacterium]|nr:S41 family peptidase [Erysipelotrichaceae bacterium]